ncbi:MAG: TolC family protein, partial [Thermoguttaceae bacterium]
MRVANDGVSSSPRQAMDVQAVAWLEAGQSPNQPPGTDQRSVGERRLDLNIPAEIPGSEARRLELPKEPAARQREIERLFPALPPLPAVPIPAAGPGGRPYTLADLQQIAAVNSPQLRQAAADVETARGNMIQANAYPNPTVSYQMQPSNNGSTPGADGFGVDQTIKTGGKLRLQTSAAEMDLHNAELALRRARSDLATQVRNAYFAVLVAKETVRVNKALVCFTEQVYRLQADLLAGGFAAPYEPAALRAQAFTARLGYRQAIQTYIYCWKQLVAAINVRQLPLAEVAGRVDLAIPYYDFDAILAYILRNHTDVLAARNGIDKARYNLKLAQVTPLPDVDVNMAVLRDFSLAPKQVTPTLTLGVPIPIWDHNKGAIMAAEGALLRAEEEPHRAEQNLTNLLAAAYMNYKNSLEALEYYRRYILPDQVRAYRGAYDRRQIDPNASFGDVVSAQQTLASNVTTYLQTLGQV